MFNKVIDRLQTNFKKGMDNSMRRLGIETDQDISLYNSLKEEDLRELVGEYGIDNMLEYIHTMEAQKMKG